MATFRLQPSIKGHLDSFILPSLSGFMQRVVRSGSCCQQSRYLDPFSGGCADWNDGGTSGMKPSVQKDESTSVKERGGKLVHGGGGGQKRKVVRGSGEGG